MKYQITLNDDDYLQYNIFYTCRTPSGKRALRTSQLFIPIFSVIFILMLLISGARPYFILTAVIFLSLLFVSSYLRTPKILEKNLRKSLKRMQKDGKLPYHARAEIEFQDTIITERYEQGEFRLKYEDIDHIYFEKDYLYIFFTAMQALVIPYRCLGAEKERVVSYLIEKRPDAWHNYI